MNKQSEYNIKHRLKLKKMGFINPETWVPGDKRAELVKMARKWRLDFFKLQEEKA